MLTSTPILSSGFWDLALQDVRQETAKGKATFVTIQFGHNDAGKTGLPPSSMGANLTQFVSQLREISPLAIPVLVTPLTRRSFIGDTGKLSDDLVDWAAGARLTPLTPWLSAPG
jgi:lysophospholipase L1-like esterase